LREINPIKKNGALDHITAKKSRVKEEMVGSSSRWEIVESLFVMEERGIKRESLDEKTPLIRTREPGEEGMS